MILEIKRCLHIRHNYKDPRLTNNNSQKVIYKGFPYRFWQAGGKTCRQTKRKTSRGAPACAAWPCATRRKPNRRVVRPLPYEKQADRTSISGLRKIPSELLYGTVWRSDGVLRPFEFLHFYMYLHFPTIYLANNKRRRDGGQSLSSEWACMTSSL